ncbi:metallophosphoesterase [Halorarum halobium]|uniref:metallophosphoesterase n=1 Tax=Halorarum halobium TaxID=3075121 RepID=UPI0028AA1811|nr:metallophosphoesterase [Halobaculum sp. XH14]
MSILCISDILWETQDKDILETLKSEISGKDPSLVLFAGDVINDGMNSDEHTAEFLELLEYLEELEITSFTIEGNHDEYSDYDAVVERTEDLEYAREISGEVAEFNGLQILGIPFSDTHRLGKARQISEEFPGSYDIVLAHAETSRRIWLLELDAGIIVTGHVAAELCRIHDHVFVSMGSYPGQRAVISTGLDELLYQRRADSFFASQDEYEAEVKIEDGELTWIRDEEESDRVGLRGLKDSNYPDRFERLISAKKRVQDVNEDEERRIIEDLLDSGVPKTHIREYINRYDFL